MNEVLGGAVIHYIDGSKDEFVFTRSDSEAELALNRIQEAMHTNLLLLRLCDRLLIVPIHNIRKIEIKPPPPKLPDTTIHNVRLID